MPELHKPRWEAFARARAAGQKQHDAYINAGYEGTPQAASELARNPAIIARIAELHAEKAESIRQQDQASNSSDIRDLGREWVLQQLKKNIQAAQTAGQISAANKGVELMMEMLNLLPKGKSAPPAPDVETDAAPAANPQSMERALDLLEKLGADREPETVQPPAVPEA